MTERPDYRPLVASETERLLATALELDADGMTQPSLCEGWSRAHVLSHLARNADALCRLADNAVTGGSAPMYSSQQVRDAEILAGAERDAETIVDDVRGSAAQLSGQLDRITPAVSDRKVEARGGVLLPAGFLPFMRLREVVLHHIDLGGDYTFADIPGGLAGDLLRDAVKRLQHNPESPAMTIRTDEGETYTVSPGEGEASADAAPEVTGPRSAVLGWVSRGLTDGVACSGPLPTLPFGG